jgi:hypothetical protein
MICLDGMIRFMIRRAYMICHVGFCGGGDGGFIYGISAYTKMVGRQATVAHE